MPWLPWLNFDPHHYDVIPGLPKQKKQPSDQSNTTSIPSGRWKLLFMLYVAVFTCEKVDLFRRTLIVVMDVVFLRGGLQKQEVHCINGHPHMVDGIEAVGVKSLDMS